MDLVLGSRWDPGTDHEHRSKDRKDKRSTRSMKEGYGGVRAWGVRGTVEGSRRERAHRARSRGGAMAAPNPESAAALANLLTKVARYAVVLGAAGSVAQASMYNGAPRRRPAERNAEIEGNQETERTNERACEPRRKPRRGTRIFDRMNKRNWNALANGNEGETNEDARKFSTETGGKKLTLPRTRAFANAILA